MAKLFSKLAKNNKGLDQVYSDSNVTDQSFEKIRAGTAGADQSYMRQDSPILPIVSGPRDEKLLFNFLKSNQGVLFLARQQILQGGNAFSQTRLYNPVSVPLMTAKYTLSSLTVPLERVDRAILSDKGIAGRIQKETIATSMVKISKTFVGGSNNNTNQGSVIGQIINTGARRLIQNILNRTTISIRKKKYGTVGQIGRTISTIAQTLSAFGRGIGSAGTLGVNETAYDELFTAKAWPVVKLPDGDLLVFDDVKKDYEDNSAVANSDSTRYDLLYKEDQWPQLAVDHNAKLINYEAEKKAYIERATKSVRSIKDPKGNLFNNFFTSPYPSYEENYRSSATYTEDVGVRVSGLVTNGVSSARYMKDPMNYTENGTIISDISELNGSHQDRDYIKFKIVVPTVFDGGISFRAFLKDIKHNAKGDYEEQRYVGRPERFIVYKGLNRSMTFELYLVAYSSDELLGVWARANMLNKLVYPIDTVSGYMVPPIIRLTLGNFMADQPGYITDIGMDFADSPWDIDEEVSQVVRLNVTFNIIEKNYITQKSGGIFAERLTDQLFVNFRKGLDTTMAKIIPELSRLNVPVPDFTPQLSDMTKPMGENQSTSPTTTVPSKEGGYEYNPDYTWTNS